MRTDPFQVGSGGNSLLMVVAVLYVTIGAVALLVWLVRGWLDGQEQDTQYIAPVMTGYDANQRERILTLTSPIACGVCGDIENGPWLRCPQCGLMLCEDCDDDLASLHDCETP